MLDWIGSIDEKRTQDAMERLVELCDHTKGRRLTYLAVKNKLIEEFGEDVYTSVKDTLLVELAMRDLEYKEMPAAAVTHHVSAAPSTPFFPEASRLYAPQVSTEEDDEEGYNLPPARPKVDIANLYRCVCMGAMEGGGGGVRSDTVCVRA
jgi:hypothetical protein